ncbi:MAG TPA: diacylglycerol kinase family protein [Xanthomonadales bacterium]|nr:diacylglycerol kinase family protein [Xanthomonadales bacterium]
MKLLVVCNPHAAHGRASRQVEALRSLLSDQHAGSTFVETMGPGHARRLVAEADLSQFEGVVAAGGDGTVFEVLNGLYAHSQDRRCPLGIIPLGTGNAFAREFGLQPTDWAPAVGRLSEGTVRRVDVGRVECADGDFHFLNIIGLGLAVDAGRSAGRLKFAGRSAYAFGALWQILKLQSLPLVMELDGEFVRQDNVFVEISNSRYTGTSFLIAPKARLDDGLLDVTWLRRLPRWRLLWLFRTIFSGRHTAYPEVGSRQAREIVLHAPAGQLLMPDGEFQGRTPARIRCLHQDLELFC